MGSNKHGRKAAPDKLKKARGNPGKRPLNEDAPEYKVEVPDPPKYLSAYAVEEWKRITPILAEKGLIAESYRAALELYCNSYSLYREAIEELGKGEKVIETKQGVYQSPWFKIMKDAYSEMKTAIVMFGLSPADVGGVKADLGKPKKKGEKLEGVDAVLEAMDNPSGGLKAVHVGKKKTG